MGADAPGDPRAAGRRDRAGPALHGEQRDPAGVYRALESLGCGWAQFIPIVVRLPEGGFSAESVSPEEYGRFLCDVFDLWVRNGLGKMDVQLFAETARILAGGKPSVCWMAEECGRAPVVEEDGGVYACDHFVDPAHRLGTLGGARLDALLESPSQDAFGRAKRDGIPAECGACPWYRFCGGGCPKDRFADAKDDAPAHYYLCGGLRALFSHAVPVLERIMGLSRQGLSPEKIMEAFRSETP